MTEIQSSSPNFLAQPLGASATGNGPMSMEKAKAAAEQFEAFFLSQFLNSMSSGLEADETFGGGESEKLFKSMLNEEYAKSMSRQNGIGIADAVLREMLAMQEVER
ncbi:MAG: chemotactic signal-response protein chel [Sneathiella sp.]|nr:MAG: chemotactic signal-response protein chel [Sneathiella sp.]